MFVSLIHELQVEQNTDWPVDKRCVYKMKTDDENELARVF